MNYEFFIAKKIIRSKSYKSSISSPIIKIGVTAIAIGIIVMLVSIATGVGLQKKIREKAVAFNGHITIANFDSNDSDESQFPILLDSTFYPNYSSNQGVSHIQGVASKFGVIRTMQTFEGVVFKGVDEHYHWEIISDYILKGRVPNFESPFSKEVVISKYIASRLDLDLGDQFEMYFSKSDIQKIPYVRKFVIVGIYESGFHEIDEKLIIGDITHLKFINKWTRNQVGSYEVFIDDFDNLEILTDAIYENIPSNLNATSVKTRYQSVFEWIEIFDNNTSGIIFIMLLVAGINMITTLLVIILEKTRLIGILKALGCNNWSIRKIFVYNALYLVLRGLIIGNVIGILILIVQQKFQLLKFPNPEQYYMSYIPVDIDINAFIFLNLGTFTACFVMLIIPSIIISKITPVRAIKFE